MSKPVIYDNAACYVNGTLLVQATSIEVEYQDSDKSQLLLGAGKKFAFARIPGGRLMAITVDEVIPIDGIEYDFVKKYLDTELVSFGVRFFGSSATVVSRGFLTTPHLSFGVGRTAGLKVGFIGDAVKFDGT